MFAISSGVASSYFIDAASGSKPITTIFGVDGRATINAPSLDSATAISPEAGDEDFGRFQLHDPWPAGPRRAAYRFASVQFSLPLLLARTGMGEPEDGGWIQMESALGRAGGAKRSSTTMSALACGSYFDGRFERRVHLRVRSEQRPQRLRLGRIHHHAQWLLRRQLDHGAVVLRKRIVRRNPRLQISGDVGSIGERRLLLAAGFQRHGLRPGRRAAELQRQVNIVRARAVILAPQRYISQDRGVVSDRRRPIFRNPDIFLSRIHRQHCGNSRARTAPLLLRARVPLPRTQSRRPAAAAVSARARRIRAPDPDSMPKRPAGIARWLLHHAAGRR